MADTKALRPAAARRAELILTELQRSGFASIGALSETLEVSEMTVRRDVRRLADGGELRQVHGGVSLPHGTLRTAGYASRAEREAAAKHAIAAAAVELIGTAGSITIDSGTTGYAFATALPQNFRGSVVTHSVPVLQHMLTLPSATVICPGGELLQESQVLIGPRTTAAARELASDIFFLGANSLDVSGVFLRGDRELPVKRAYMGGSSRVVLMVDGSKLRHTSPVKLAEVAELSAIVTTGPVPDALRELCQELSVQLHVAEVPVDATA